MIHRNAILRLLLCPLFAVGVMGWSQPVGSIARGDSQNQVPATGANQIDNPAVIDAAGNAVLLADLSRAEQTMAKRAFLSKYSYNTGQENWCLAAGDFNRDGKTDLVTASKGSDQIRVMFNDGTGEFSNSRTFGTLQQTRALCILDANKDGWVDVASITMIGELSILLNDKKGGFFLPKVIETDRMLQSISSADLNKDGAPDIMLAAVSENSVIVYYNDGFGFYPGEGVRIATGSKPRVIRCADFNKDGRPDMVVGCDDGYLYLHMNAAKAPFQTYTTLRSCSDNWGLAITDINHDNKPDIVSASYSERQVCVHINKQDTLFNRTQCIASGVHNFDLVADDFNLDGTVDIITCSANDQSINFHPSGADGVLEQRISVLSGSWNSSMVAADFDSDGDVDIATASILDKSINVHRNISNEIRGTKRAKLWIEGTIINADVNSPVPFQPITLLDRKGNVAATTISNFEGKYFVNAEAGQSYTVQIRHSNLPLFKVSVQMPDTVLKRDFRLSRNTGATVQGRVTHKLTGEPISNVYLEIRDINDSLLSKLFTDTRGVYKSFVPLGLRYKVVAQHTEYKPTDKSFDITETDAGDVVDINIDLDPNFVAVSVYGSVNDFLFATPLPMVSLVFQDMETGKEVTSVVTSDEGSYNVMLPVGKYRVFATKRGFYYNSTAFELTTRQVSAGARQDVSLPPMRAGTAMVLEEMTYPKASDYAVSSLPKESLRSLVKMMLDNPTLVAEIEGHTDGDGSAQANMDLSQKRADGIAKYLIENGVSAKRIHARGYGETAPVADNATEEGRRQNRRIVFKIVAY